MARYSKRCWHQLSRQTVADLHRRAISSWRSALAFPEAPVRVRERLRKTLETSLRSQASGTLPIYWKLEPADGEARKSADFAWVNDIARAIIQVSRRFAYGKERE